MKYLLINKPRCMTPLEAITIVKGRFPDLKNSKIGYAGRLDPMAQGLLILLVGDETKKRDEYQSLDKEYMFTALFGIETDSYDVLGIINKVADPKNAVSRFANIPEKFNGNFKQKYPPFSSKTIDGKPLYYWQRKGMLDDMKIPEKSVTISNLSLVSHATISKEKLIENTVADIKNIKGDFRQEEIIKAWLAVDTSPITEFALATFSCSVTSGTYIRSLVHEMGREIDCPSLAYSIMRTRVGQFFLNDPEVIQL